MALQPSKYSALIVRSSLHLTASIDDQGLMLDEIAFDIVQIKNDHMFSGLMAWELATLANRAIMNSLTPPGVPPFAILNAKTIALNDTDYVISSSLSTLDCLLGYGSVIKSDLHGCVYYEQKGCHLDALAAHHGVTADASVTSTVPMVKMPNIKVNPPPVKVTGQGHSKIHPMVAAAVASYRGRTNQNTVVFWDHEDHPEQMDFDVWIDHWGLVANPASADCYIQGVDLSKGSMTSAVAMLGVTIRSGGDKAPGWTGRTPSSRPSSPPQICQLDRVPLSEGGGFDVSWDDGSVIRVSEEQVSKAGGSAQEAAERLRRAES